MRRVNEKNWSEEELDALLERKNARDRTLTRKELHAAREWKKKKAAQSGAGSGNRENVGGARRRNRGKAAAEETHEDAKAKARAKLLAEIQSYIDQLSNL